MKKLTVHYISRKRFEYGGHRPYTAMLYYGYNDVEERTYKDAYVLFRGEARAIHHMFIAYSGDSASVVIIYR